MKGNKNKIREKKRKANQIVGKSSKSNGQQLGVPGKRSMYISATSPFSPFAHATSQRWST